MTDISHVQADPKRPYKAYVAAALTAAYVFITLYLADKGGRGGFTRDELLGDLGAAILGSGLIGGGTYLKKNPKVALWDHRGERGAVSLLWLVAVALLIVVVLFVIIPWARG